MAAQSTYDRHLTGTVDYVIGNVRAQFMKSDPPVVNHLLYGAMSEDPGLLAVFFMFDDAAALDRARRQGLCARIRRTLLDLLAEEGYPVECLSPDQVSFASEEDILVSSGPWPFYR